MDQSISQSEAARTALEAPSDASLRVACYCEENVWRLAYRHLNGKPSPTSSITYHVVFVSNERHCVAMWHQMARQGGPCFWDYHVLLIETRGDGQTFVLDMDSQLPYPCSFEEYLEDTFLEVMGQYAPLFRVIEASVYIQHFCSDRSHMFNETTKTWSAPPPSYACIGGSNRSGETSNLKEYMDMQEPKFGIRSQAELQKQATNNRFGVVMTLTELQDFFE